MIYEFENEENEKNLKNIIHKVKKCQKIIEEEEIKLNIFINEKENKIKYIKSLFKDYKERNLTIIFFIIY